MSNKKIYNNIEIEKVLDKFLKDVEVNKKIDASPKEFAAFLEYGLNNDIVSIENLDYKDGQKEAKFTIRVKTK